MVQDPKLMNNVRLQLSKDLQGLIHSVLLSLHTILVSLHELVWLSYLVRCSIKFDKILLPFDIPSSKLQESARTP